MSQGRCANIEIVRRRIVSACSVVSGAAEPHTLLKSNTNLNSSNQKHLGSMLGPKNQPLSVPKNQEKHRKAHVITCSSLPLPATLKLPWDRWAMPCKIAGARPSQWQPDPWLEANAWRLQKFDERMALPGSWSSKSLAQNHSYLLQEVNFFLGYETVWEMEMRSWKKTVAVCISWMLILGFKWVWVWSVHNNQSVWRSTVTTRTTMFYSSRRTL